jgi:hypothetical protein
VIAVVTLVIILVVGGAVGYFLSTRNKDRASSTAPSVSGPGRSNSNNAGKIEGTKWRSLRGFVKGQDIPAGTLRLEFNRDGSLVYHTPMGEFRGTYTLDPGDTVVWNFTRELGGSRRHQQTCIINGNRMTVKDTDGTTLDFEPQ